MYTGLILENKGMLVRKTGKKGKKKYSIRRQLWIFIPHLFKFRTFIMPHLPKQYAFLEFLVENKAFCSTKRALRADTARNK